MIPTCTKMRGCHAGFKSFPDWGQFVDQKSNEITTGFRMTYFYRIDCVDGQRCQMKKNEIGAFFEAAALFRAKASLFFWWSHDRRFSHMF